MLDALLSFLRAGMSVMKEQGLQHRGRRRGRGWWRGHDEEWWRCERNEEWPGATTSKGAGLENEQGGGGAARAG